MRKLCTLFLLLLTASCGAWGQARRKVIINQDSAGPGGSDLQTILMMIQSPQVEVLGITVVSGNLWRDEEVAHTLRLLEIIGRTDIPVMPGAVFPLVREREETELWQERYGRVAYSGAWDKRWWHEPFAVPTKALPEGMPKIKPAAEDAAHFLVRMVRKYPHEVTIYEGGPMTNLALAMAIDPEFPELAQELVFMGGSLNPATDDPEFANNPRHEFNFWFDPEAANKVLQGEWKRITCTPTDISIKTKFTAEMAKEIGTGEGAVAKYVAKYFDPNAGSNYMWDELAAAGWLDQTLITKKESRYMGVDIDHGASYGNTLTWMENDKPRTAKRMAEIQVDLDTQRFYKMFVGLMKAPTSTAH